ncbi:MAG TPA: ABC transporter permease [Alphaproteobacteria bacterium]|nr:ABC transporter permease [Alphaproteobacteria bacterium]
MKFLAYIRSLAAKLLHRSQVTEDMEVELRSHIQHRADDLERSGLDRAEAERRARIEFGGQERFKEESYRALGGNFIETLVQDVRFSLRLLRKSPGFTVAAVLTLALGIGANAVVFAVLNGLILRPLNVPQEQSLYAIDRHGIGFESYPNYLDLRDRNRSFEQLVIYNISNAGLDTGKDLSRVWGIAASGNYFDALGIQPYLGRFFHSADEHGPNSAPYIVLSYAYWHTHFQDDRSVVGRAVRLNKHPFTIVGVAPPEFHGTIVFFAPDFFAPIVNQEQLDGEDLLHERGKRRIFGMMGHLKPGVTPALAASDLSAIGSDLEKIYPKDDSKMNYVLVRPGLGGDFLGRPIREFVAGLMLLAALILLAACANLGSLFGARAADRSREVALRLALGSSRSRILRGLLTEATLISLAGGTVGLMVSVVLLRRLSTWQPFTRFPLHVPVNPDINVYVVALALALVSGILFGIVPVRQVLRANPYEIVKAGSTGRIGRRITVRDVLVVVQIAICAVLVTSSIVAVRGLVRSLHSNFGIEPQKAMLVNPDLNMAGYSGEAVPAMRRRMIDAMETIPGVKSVGLVDLPLLAFDGRRLPVFTDTTTDLTPAKAAARPFVYNIAGDYFDAAGTGFLSGRTFTWHDDKNAPPVAVINQEFARTIFGSATAAIGKYFKMSDGTRVQVVGIVEDGKYFNLTEDHELALFLPIQQSPAGATWLVVRAKNDPQQLATAIRAKLRALDEGMIVYMQPWNKEMDGVMFPSRMATISLGVLGVMGAMLSITGIFGMAAYSVSKRLRELGIRMALGAQRKEVLEAALGRAVKLLAYGSLAGLFLGILATRVLAFIVYQASPRDPVVLAGAVLAMALLGLLATWIPAQRALSIDPVILLREE